MIFQWKNNYFFVFVLFISFFLFPGICYGGSKKTASYQPDITPYLVLHHLPAGYDHPSMEYQGVFNDNHLFIHNKDNALLLFDKATMSLQREISIPRGRNDGELTRLNTVASFDNMLWFADSGNRISRFRLDGGSLNYQGVGYIPGMRQIIRIFATSDYLYVFGVSQDNHFSLKQCAHQGTVLKEIRSFPPPVPGNILFSTDISGNLMFAFQYESLLYRLTPKKLETFSLSQKIVPDKKSPTLQKNGMVYNIGQIGSYYFATYWNTQNGGTLELFYASNHRLYALIRYPLGQGYYSDGSLYIYRHSFQDKKQKAFIVEVRLSSLVQPERKEKQ